MKQYIFISFFLVGCGQLQNTFTPTPPMNCTVVTNSLGEIITCPNGNTNTIYNGIQGVQGPQGTTGPQGPQGLPGTSGQSQLPGMICDIYSILSSDYSGTVDWNTMFNHGALKFSVVMDNFNIPNQSNTNLFNGFTQDQQNLIGYTNWAMDCSGYLTIPETNIYTFVLSSDDGSQLGIDEQTIIDMPQAQSYTTNSASVSLYSGQHRINLMYFQGPATNIGLNLSFQGPNNMGLNSLQLIENLTH